MKDEDKIKEQFTNELVELRRRISELEKLESQCRQAEKALREAEAKYRSIFENAVEGIFQIALDGHIIAANQAAARMLGYDSHRELIAEVADIRQLYIDPWRRDEFIRLIQTKGIVTGIESQVRRKDGSVIWTSSNVRALRDSSGRMTGFEGMVMDITERKRAEQELQESEERYRSTLDSMLEGCQIIGFDWRYLYVNDAVAAHGRKAKEELLGRTMMEMYPGIENTTMFAALQRCMDKRIPQRMENEFTFPDGSRGWFELSIQPLPDGIFVLSLDITERKRAEETLKNYAAKLEDANRLKDLFTDIMRHDLLNPMGIIKTATEQILLTETKDERMCNTLQMVKRNADKLIDMIKSASMYAMLESTEKLERSKLDLNEIFREVMNNFKSQLKEKSMKLEYKSKGGCCVMANPMIDAVFSNLISNAIKYSPAGKKIEVNIIEEKEHFKIYVKDWGYGIKDVDKLKIFTRFQTHHSKILNFRYLLTAFLLA